MSLKVYKYQVNQILTQAVMYWVISWILNKSHSKLYKIMYFVGLHQGKLGMRGLIFYCSKGSATYNIAVISMWELFYSFSSHKISYHKISYHNNMTKSETYYYFTPDLNSDWGNWHWFQTLLKWSLGYCVGLSKCLPVINPTSLRAIQYILWIKIQILWLSTHHNHA